MQQGLLSAFNPSDALPAPRYTGMLLPIERDMYGNKGNFELAVPQFLQDAYSGINKFGQAFRGELNPQELQQLAFDTSMNVTGGSLLGSRVIPNAVPSGGILGMGVSKTPNQTGLLGKTNQVTPETGLLGKVDNVQPQTGIAEVVPPTDKTDGIFAFHGSGADFDKFSLNKIGTGEGNQAFGYGLYFTDSEDIAKFYKNTVTFQDQTRGKLNLEYKGEKFIDLGDTAQAENASTEYRVLTKLKEDMASYLPANPKLATPQEAKNRLLKRLDVEINKYSKAGQTDSDVGTIDLADGSKLEDLITKSLQNEKDALLKIDPNDINVVSGKTYEVKIKAVMDDLIDYDKSLRQQNDKVKKILKPYYEYYGVAETADFGTLLASTYRHLPQDEFSERLAKEGIKGIKYKSGQLSGITDSKATNYVIFDDKIIDIMKKYGIVGAVGVTAMQGRGNQNSEADLSL